MSSYQLRIGLDFDNTIADYDEVFHGYALKRGWITRDTRASKNAVRDQIRETHGNDAWTELQAHVYSDGMAEASLTDGIKTFFEWARTRKALLYVISHKTIFAAIGNKIDLRTPAIQWMEANGFFSPDALGLKIDSDVFFEETREGKLKRIATCHVTHFIDDLEDVLLDPLFPAGAERIFYNPKSVPASDKRIRSFSSWEAITKHLESSRK